jgi:hypothetical protein
MMNRDLMQRQMFRNGGGVVPMQDGGEPTFRERIEALSKVGCQCKAYGFNRTLLRYEPQFKTYPDYSGRTGRRRAVEIQQGLLKQMQMVTTEYGDYGVWKGACQDPSAPMNLSPEEQAARWVRAQYEIENERQSGPG